MKILSRTFLFPIYVHKTSTIFGDKPNLSVRFDTVKMAGTMRTIAYTFQVETRKRKYQWSIVWRPSVTRYWWMRKLRRGRLGGNCEKI